METVFYSYRPTDLAKMPHRPSDSHKGTFGRVLVVGGSIGMSGAAFFAGKAAYRMGAGLVEILTHEDNRAILQTSLPEAIVTTYGNAVVADRAKIRAAVARADVIAIGMGIGQSENANELLKIVLSASEVPLVIDADALNLIAKDPSVFDLATAPMIVTPHLLEMARLCRMDLPTLKRDMVGIATDFAEKYALICVLKCHETLVVSDGTEDKKGLSDKNKVYVNHSGNSGMATGGSGDILSGMIASLIAQKMPPLDAATLGVYVHGLAGDAAAEALGEHSVMASDIIAAIPEVIKDCHD